MNWFSELLQYLNNNYYMANAVGRNKNCGQNSEKLGLAHGAQHMYVKCSQKPDISLGEK